MIFIYVYIHIYTYIYVYLYICQYYKRCAKLYELHASVGTQGMRARKARNLAHSAINALITDSDRITDTDPTSIYLF